MFVGKWSERVVHETARPARACVKVGGVDGTQFDRLTRAFARVGTRRQVVAGAAAVAIGAGVAGADAATRCRAGRQTCQRDNQCCSGICRRGKDVPLKDRNRCACGDGETQCGNACVDLAHDERNCGACGRRCRSGDLCCPDGCRDAKTDEENCGACGNHCDTGEGCANGSCVDLTTDPLNCGAIGHVCKHGSPCTSGVCDYRDACRVVYDGDWGDCFFDTDGNIYPRDLTTYIKLDSIGVPCEGSSQCQDHPICDLDTNSCICLVGEVYGAGPDDSALYLPTECYASYRESVCSDPDIAAGYRACYATVEGDGWGGYTDEARTLIEDCWSSAECQELDPKCSEVGYRCSCIYSTGPGNGTLDRMPRTACIIDNTLPV